MSRFIELMLTFNGSDGERTKALYAELGGHGAAGELAVNLFRAAKSSSRAKVYRGGGYRGKAYERKDWSLGQVADVLGREAAALGIDWGWKEDPAQPFHKWVLYVVLPTGQVSFHQAERGAGPDFAGDWDQVRDMGPTRICSWIGRVLAAGAGA